MASRERLLDRLRSEKVWDVAVVGGGATGLGSALDSSTRGYSTVLLEASDFAKGTSSRSTKLVHGGVRYLARGELSLVREALRERAIMRSNAPQLVHDRAFLVPAYDDWSKLFYGVGLKVYDLLAGDGAFFRSRFVSAAEAGELAPSIRRKKLRGGVVYHDGQFDDARFAISLLRSFADESKDALALNYMKVSGFLRAGGKIAGVRAVDAETGTDYEVKARVVINATGVFADEIRTIDDAAAPPSVEPSQGAHIVLDRSFMPGETALLVPKTDDGRVVFAIPWHGRTLVGTTDAPVGSIELEPKPMDSEISFLLDAVGKYLEFQPKRSEILSAFAGLRPLARVGKARSTAKLSREHHVEVSTSGLVTITGGKWTTYRVMAADAVNQAAVVAGLDWRPCWTQLHRLHGWSENHPSSGDIASGYGSDQSVLEGLTDDRPELSEPLHPRLPYLLVHILFAARFEMARTIEDVLSRRTRSLC